LIFVVMVPSPKVLWCLTGSVEETKYSDCIAW
jgi:hypothetical protein